jgi:hypothetical protein
MDLIYSCAIIHCSGYHWAQNVRLPGVSKPWVSFFYDTSLHKIHHPTSPKYFLAESHISGVKRSLWNNRGWTFQERFLSPRCLYTCDYGVFLTCTHGRLYSEFRPMSEIVLGTMGRIIKQSRNDFRAMGKAMGNAGPFKPDDTEMFSPRPCLMRPNASRMFSAITGT